MENNVIRTLDQAIKKLDEAREELGRPEEDVVSFLVCKNAQFAIENLLKAYLLKNNIDPAEYKTVDSLYKKCRSINKNFEQIDLSGFNCKATDMNKSYCTDTPTVSKCYRMADELNSFLRKEQLFS
ncbi:HEPN domain-containing protein [Gramella jeungdoensis]|uniref:HEPN domain-containing protein n=1 Tax=Gramella jeungdoensis TaxID=708091 RepID=A0ABT0YY52_9FLAO|nr:HEPN domain-containing protein [Gramella jeungdoensis]MCM8568399.1 HEPN domain-containing protein [Gramella jeungdoensis]